MTNKNIEGKVVVITGAGGGVGAGTPTLLFSPLPSTLLKKQS
jgi:NADP-dependent 3-hydroxy acid dehydrogenase YdfG